MLKIVKNVKNNWTFNTFHGPLLQEWIDGRYWSPALICHANENNEYLRNFDSGLYWKNIAASYQVVCIDKSHNIPGLKQRNIHEQGYPSMKSQFYSHTIIEDSIRHNIAQMTSTSKAYIPCLPATIIKWCHIIAWDRRQLHDGGH